VQVLFASQDGYKTTIEQDRQRLRVLANQAKPKRSFVRPAPHHQKLRFIWRSDILKACLFRRASRSDV
jgi:hypothetical protein